MSGSDADAAPEYEEHESDTSDIRVILSLDRLGELIASVACHMAAMRDVELPDLDGDEGRALAAAGYRRVLLMADRAQFQASVAADLATLGDAPESEVTE